MKSAHALVACSLLSASCVFVSCGSSDDKIKVKPNVGGAGGEAGQAGGRPSSGGSTVVPALGGQGGQGGEPVMPAAGMGGVPLSVGGAGGMSGEGGAGGQAPQPLCFPLDAAGGAGQGGAGGQGGATTQPFTFRCSDLNLGYHIDTHTVAIDLKQGSEFLPVTGGHFKYTYLYLDDTQTQQPACYEESQVDNADGALKLPIAPTHPVSDSILVGSLVLHDDCGQEIAMDTSGSFDGTCHIPQIFYDSNQQTWTIDCYEGFGTDCETTCPAP